MAIYANGKKVSALIYKKEESNERFGLTLDNTIGKVNSNGTLQMPAGTANDIVFSGVKDITGYGLYYKFYQNDALTGRVLFPDLIQLSNGFSCLNAFFGCNKITGIDLSVLATVSGISACNNMFNNCSKITIVNLPSLTTISGMNGCVSMFQFCGGITQANLTALSIVTGSNACGNMFCYCTALTDVYFNSLTTTSFGTTYTNQFNGMLSNTGSTVTHTLHFPSNLESTIAGLTGYPLFGGTSGYVVLSYDLPATT